MDGTLTENLESGVFENCDGSCAKPVRFFSYKGDITLVRNHG